MRRAARAAARAVAMHADQAVCFSLNDADCVHAGLAAPRPSPDESSEDEEPAAAAGFATSDDFARKLGLGGAGWWAQTAMRGSADDARPRYTDENTAPAEDEISYSARSQMTEADREARDEAAAARREREQEASLTRVEEFATQLRQRGFAIVQLHPPGAAAAAAAAYAGATPEDAGVVCKMGGYGTPKCGTKLTEYVPTEAVAYTCTLMADGKVIECTHGDRDAEEATTVRARAVIAQPQQAETKLSNALELKGAVALVKRGGCSFLEKAERAAAAGALAIVVIDSASASAAAFPRLDEPGHVESSLLPVLMVQNDDGAVLASAAEVVLNLEIDPDDFEACSVCGVKENTSLAAADTRGPRQCVFWSCDACAKSEDEYRSDIVCNHCYQDQLKYQQTASTFSELVPKAERCVQRLFGLEPGTKFALRTSRRDDGFTHIEGDKELYHWSGESKGLISDRFGQQSDIGMLRTRLLNLGADIVSSLVQCEAGLKLPAPIFTRKPGGFFNRGFDYPRGPEDGQLTEQGFLTDEEKANCDEWLYKGLACQNTSLLSAFRYVAKPGPLHCEAHKDKGLLTIVLNPCGKKNDLSLLLDESDRFPKKG
jgi:hypothetical protein